MKEKIQALSRFLKKYLDFVILGIYIVFLAYIGMRVYMEYNAPSQPLEAPPPWNPESHHPEKFDDVLGLIKPRTELEQDERFIALGKFNMFDYKIVRDRDEILKELDAKYDQAEKLYKEGNLQGAKKVLTEILSSWPIHMRSRELLTRIDEVLNPTPTPSPTPGPRPPGFPEEIPPEFR